MDNETKIPVMLSVENLYDLCHFLEKASFSYFSEARDFVEPYLGTAECKDAYDQAHDEFIEPMKACDSLSSYFRTVLISNGCHAPFVFKENFTENTDDEE